MDLDLTLGCFAIKISFFLTILFKKTVTFFRAETEQLMNRTQKLLVRSAKEPEKKCKGDIGEWVI